MVIDFYHSGYNEVFLFIWVSQLTILVYVLYPACLDMLLVEDSNTPYQGALQLHNIPRPLVPIAALRLDELDNGAGERLARPKTR